MEQEFDNEIDALLRKLRPTDIPVGAFPVHLEADDVAAFAENAVPDAARQLLTLHLAECQRCRRILSETIRMNSEERLPLPAAAAIPAAEVANANLPWYRRLFGFPELVYVMGALVLMFSGFLGYLALRDTDAGVSTVSQVDKEIPAVRSVDSDAGNSVADPQVSANAPANTPVSAANFAAASANRTTSTNSSAAVEGFADTKREDFVLDGAPAPVTGVLDGVSTAQPPPPPPPAAAAGTATTRDERARAAELSKEKDDSTASVVREQPSKVAQEREEAKLRSAQGTAAKKAIPAGPSRDMQSQFPNRVQNYALPTKNAGGKLFVLRDGIWYDSAYNGEATINVRRGTEAFLRLDGGLRSIAETVGDTSVIVWKRKAYRIQ